MSDRYKCVDQLFVPFGDGGSENRGFVVIGGLAIDLQDKAAMAVVETMMGRLEYLLHKLELRDWYTWHAAQCAMKSLNLTGSISVEAVNYFEVCVAQMYRVYVEDVHNMELMDYQDFQKIQMLYDFARSTVDDPSELVERVAKVLRKKIVEYAEATHDDPLVEFGLRREVVLRVALLGVTLRGID